MAPQPVVTGLSPKEGPPGTRVVIRGEFLGNRSSDLIGLTICGNDCLLSAEWKSSNKIVAHTGSAKGKGDVIITTISGGIGTSTVQFRAYHETIGPMKESAVWVEECTVQQVAWGRRNITPAIYSRDDPLGLSIEGNENHFPEDIRDVFPEGSSDLSQENFSPEWYLFEKHFSTTFDDLKAGLAYTKRKVESQKQGQLSFLKSNTGSVLDQLDTLVTIRNRVCDSKQINVSTHLKDIHATICDSARMSTNVFQEVMKRREKADTTRNALIILNRYRFLFCLPKSIDQNATLGEYDAIINDYSRALNFVGKGDSPIFRLLLNEVHQRILNVRKKLHHELLQLPQSVQRQKKSIKSFLNLKVQHPELMEMDLHFDPAWEAIETRAKYLEETLKKTYNDHLIKISNPAERSKHNSSIGVHYVDVSEAICNVTINQLPEIWKLGQSYFAGELRSHVDPNPLLFKEIILNSIDKMCFYLRSAVFSGIDSREVGHVLPAVLPASCSTVLISQLLNYLPQCLRHIRNTYAAFISLDLPNDALDIVQAFIDEIRILCLSTFFKRTTEKIKRLGEQEKWITCNENFPGVTLLPTILENLVVETLQDGRICTEPELRENNVIGKIMESHKEISESFQEMLIAFCHVVENLAYSINEDDTHIPFLSQLIGLPSFQQNTAFGHSDMSWEQRMLCCMANCLFCERFLFADLKTHFLNSGFSAPETAIATGISHISKLFINLLETYVENKSDPLVGTIEPSMYIAHFQWDAVDCAHKVRPYIQECHDNLIGVFSEIVTISPPLLHPIMEPIIQTVAEELARLMSCVPAFSAYGSIQAQIDIKFLADVLSDFVNETARAHFSEAIETIGILPEEDAKIVLGVLSKSKKNIRLQSSCFSINSI